MLWLPWREIDPQTIAATRFLSADFCKRRAVVLPALLAARYNCPSRPDNAPVSSARSRRCCRQADSKIRDRARSSQSRPDKFADIPGTIEATRDRDDSSVRRAEGGRVPSPATARDERA